MIESNPIGKLVRPVLKLVFILGGLALIIAPMLGMTGTSLVQLVDVIAGAVCTVFGLIVASQAGLLARVLVKIKAPSPVLAGIVTAAVIVGFVLGFFLGRLLLHISVIVCIILLIVAGIVAAYCTIQAGMLLSLAAVSPLLLSDEDRETLRKNVKNNHIPANFTYGIGEKQLDKILFEQGLVSRNHIRLSDD